MRIRIIRVASGSIDGMPLDRFEAGQVYNVGTLIGNYLLASGLAEPAQDDEADSPAGRPAANQRDVPGAHRK